MKSIIVSSTAPYSGKSGVSLALASALEGRGLKAGYFKPYGTMPLAVDGLVTDQDAHFINAALASPGPGHQFRPSSAHEMRILKIYLKIVCRLLG